MPDLTEEEYDALDDLWTRTTPKLSGKPGYYTTHMAPKVQMVEVDLLTAQWVRVMVEKTQRGSAQIIGELVREKIAGLQEA